MTGLYIFLGIVGGIILLLLAILSVPLRVEMGYDNYVRLKVKWLFVKLNILPVSEKKGKKKKKEEKPKDKTSEDKPQKEKPKKEKKPNPIKEMLRANGYDGMMEILGNLGRYIKKLGVSSVKAFRFKNITVHICVGKGDAAQTAIEYGKACEYVFPLVGMLCANTRVKTYDVNVEPDFLANHSDGEFYAAFNVCPRRLLRAPIAFVFRLLYGVAFKFFRNWRKNRSRNNPSVDGNNDKTTTNSNKQQQSKDSASQERMATQ